MNKGEYKVGIDFNPSGDDKVGYLKWKAAQFINAVDDIEESFPEVARLKALAMTAAEEAAMWAVKAQTKKPQEA